MRLAGGEGGARVALAFDRQFTEEGFDFPV